jgi:hypothetical protein
MPLQPHYPWLLLAVMLGSLLPLMHNQKAAEAVAAGHLTAVWQVQPVRQLQAQPPWL